MKFKRGVGRPSAAFTALQWAIFIHGWFRAGHEGFKASHKPGIRSDCWAAKFEHLKARNKRQEKQAAETGWRL